MRLGSPPHPFIKWLKGDDEPIFWVSGKAASGKSTLMKYVWRDRRLKKCLMTWAGGSTLLLCHFFLSDRGDNLQKSREGILQGVLLQLIKAEPELAIVGFPLVFDSAGFATMPLVPINWKSLKGALDRIISFTEAKDWKICMFINGLDKYRNIERVADYTEEELNIITHSDEADASWGTNALISDNRREILKFLLNLARTSSGLKLCLSSRELAAFEEALSRFPRLRVHEHTREDITAYALTSFSNCAVASPARRKALADDIAQRSSGVFLWVRLVVDHIIALYSNEGEQADLHKALGLFPRQLGGQNGLYMKMLSLVAEKDRLDGRRVI